MLSLFRTENAHIFASFFDSEFIAAKREIDEVKNRAWMVLLKRIMFKSYRCLVILLGKELLVVGRK